jgi:1-acyl-sn-glycerol-3-phosphate acyltransferase
MLIFDFIFMKRKLNEDQANMVSNLERAKKNVETPMWLLIYPEGTGMDMFEHCRTVPYYTF